MLVVRALKNSQLIRQLPDESHVIYGKDTRPDPNTYWVVPGQLLASEYPGARDPEEARRRLRRFLDVAVRHFIDLTEADELEPYTDLLTEEADFKTTYERIPIDVSVPEEPKTWQRLSRPLIAEWQKAELRSATFISSRS